ncbi:MAG: hypothetical protein ABI680_11140 [Chthoniobacteraceae bacterium]
MQRSIATTAKPRSTAERKARFAEMVKLGHISAERAKLIEFRKPTANEREFAETLVPKARKFLAKKSPTTA